MVKSGMIAMLRRRTSRALPRVAIRLTPAEPGGRGSGPGVPLEDFACAVLCALSTAKLQSASSPWGFLVERGCREKGVQGEDGRRGKPGSTVSLLRLGKAREARFPSIAASTVRKAAACCARPAAGGVIDSRLGTSIHEVLRLRRCRRTRRPPTRARTRRTRVRPALQYSRAVDCYIVSSRPTPRQAFENCRI
jgi:hypothetical protein